jgi:hypothetical protein
VENPKNSLFLRCNALFSTFSTVLLVLCWYLSRRGYTAADQLIELPQMLLGPRQFLLDSLFPNAWQPLSQASTAANTIEQPRPTSNQCPMCRFAGRSRFLLLIAIPLQKLKPCSKFSFLLWSVVGLELRG